MVALNDTIKRIVLSIVLLGGAVLSVCRSAFASNVNVNVEICGNASTEPLINLNYVNGDTVFYNPIVMNFRGDWLYDLTIERNNDIILGTTTLSFGSGQVFSQTIDLTSGVNNLKLKYNGGCPRRTVEQNLVLNYQPYGASVNLVTTSNNSPELTGRIAVSDHKINITINGRTYPAINNGDGTWRLPAGTISPALADGTYNIVLQVLDKTTNATLGTTNANGALIIAGSIPTVVIDRNTTNNPSPALGGTISSPYSRIEVTINGRTYPAINNGDGTWRLPAGTISPALADGTYNIVLQVLDKTTNATLGTTNANGALIIAGSIPTVVIDRNTTNNPSPALGGTISSPYSRIEVTINGRTYPAINNGDGTWRLPAGTIAPLASGEYDLTISAADRAGNITTKKLTFVVRAVNEIGFVLPPHTGYIRINRVNIPSWLIYLLIFGLVWLLSRLKCGFRKAESERTSL